MEHGRGLRPGPLSPRQRRGPADGADPGRGWLLLQSRSSMGSSIRPRAERVTRVAPASSSAASPSGRGAAILDSAHRGIAMNGTRTSCCGAGRCPVRHDRAPPGLLAPRARARGAHLLRPPRARTGTFYILVAGSGTLAVFSYATERQVARVPVGDHPPARAHGQRVDRDLRPGNRLRPGALTLRTPPSTRWPRPFRGASPFRHRRLRGGCRCRCGSCCGAVCGASPGPEFSCTPPVRGARSPAPFGSRAASRAAVSRLARASPATTSCSPAARGPRGCAENFRFTPWET